MSRKTLLTESEVRQFLKLANIGPVGDAKIEEMYSADEEEMDEGGMRPGMREPGMRDDEEEPGMRDMREEDDEMDAIDAMDDADADMDDAADDMDDAEMDMGAETPAAGQMVSVEDFMGALERALEDVLGDEVDVDMDDEEGADDMEDAAMDIGGADMDMGDEEEPMMEADAEKEEEEEEEDDGAAAAKERGAKARSRARDRNQPRQVKSIREDDDIVAEVARRVAKRLQSKQNQQKVIDDLTERIFAKISSK